jgi:acyl transferase domain-containing protein
MFSGQGSQYFQMGKALFDHNSVFRDWIMKLDAVALRVSGHSVARALYMSEQDAAPAFERTLLTHPAIFMVEYSLAQALMSAGVHPDLTWGASIGSFAAAAIAGFIDAEEALTILVGHANALQDNCQKGGMLAILADCALFQQELFCRRSELAAVNFRSHFVVAAPLPEIALIQEQLRDRGVPHQRLPVEFAFHSRWIDAARPAFESQLGGVRPRAGRMPMMCCERAAMLTRLPPGYFWDVTRRPIRFGAAAVTMMGQGACRYIDVGPAGTHAALLKYSLTGDSASTIHTVLTPFGRDVQNFAALTQMRH